MYHGKRSPFSVKVKTKRVKLYIIKKDDYSNICDSYKNVIQRIQKKEKKNIKKIKNILIKTIDRFCHSNGIHIKDEYKPSIEKATKELNKNMLPDIFKNNNFSQSELTNEIDEKINKTIKEFNTKFRKVSTKIASYKSKKEIINKERRKLKSLNINKTKIRPQQRSLNILRSGNMGSNILQSFKPNYNDKFLLSKKSPSLDTEKVNNLLFQKIIEGKKMLSEQIKKSEDNNNNTNGINNVIKIDEIIPVVATNVDSDKTLENFNFNYTDSEKESNKTMKLRINDNESIGKEPLTLNNLPEELQKIIKSRIENEQMLKNKGNKENSLKIEHIHIEINNYKNNISYKALSTPKKMQNIQKI